MVYCRRRSGNFWRMRASLTQGQSMSTLMFTSGAGVGFFWRMRTSLGLACVNQCAQAATLGTQVIGRPRSRPRAPARPRTDSRT